MNNEKYLKIPQEIKNTKRWICYRIEEREGRKTKVPYNAINGSYAKSNDYQTWSSFNVAILGCEKYKMDGIGFMLGEDIVNNTCYFGIDLDNHEDENGNKPLTKEEFNDFCNEFIKSLNSYTEYSHSGDGVHIICKGKLPEGARRKNGVAVEMYDKGRFFTMSGNVINAVPIMERSAEIKPLWEKYLKPKVETIIANNVNGIVFGENVVEISIDKKPTNINDKELISTIVNSRYGNDFLNLYNGNISTHGNDHSAADLALCKILAFWTGCDRYQMDRIFRTSGLMREKWDKLRGEETYGNRTINLAISNQINVYTPPKERENIIISKSEEKEKSEKTEADFSSNIVNFDEKGDPIVDIKPIFKKYPLTDTGNAERFYDYFGEYFRFNKDNKNFMFWNGKTWILDVKDYHKKYADKMLGVFSQEIKNTQEQIKDAVKQDDKEKIDYLKSVEKAQIDNLKKVSNKAGKEAMINELKHLHDIPVVNSEFDTQTHLLNTDSGVVDLNTGEIKPFDKNLKLSKNTNCKVSFEEPTIWLKFLKDIFNRKDEKETQEIIDTIQLGLGESLTGRTNKEHLYILHGSGSNGKSTFIKTTTQIFGDYATSMNSDMLLQNQNSSSQSTEFSLASLLGKRMVSTSETAEGKKLDEVMIKQMLSGEKMSAQFKYGNQFSFLPSFSPWMSTNNKPIIRATDFGTWRRIFFIPFLNTFTEEMKDVDMPQKLEKESPQILGWMIQGAVKLRQQYQNKIPKPKCLEEALSDYKKELDVIVAFISARCIPFPEMEIEADTLYRTYKEWCKDNGEYCYSESRFKLEMPKKGYKLRKDLNKGWVYCGLKLASDKRGIVFGE